MSPSHALCSAVSQRNALAEERQLDTLGIIDRTICTRTSILRSALFVLALLTGACDAVAFPTSEPSAVVLTVDTESRGRLFDRRLLGTNVPAWIGPDRLRDPEFVSATVESGVSLLRMPGGSWSNAYDWMACELREEQGCVFPHAARPTDFIDFMQATGLPGSWTVSINNSAQHAAAAVAFFNGGVGDPTTIGVDRYGVDWGTVGSWAGIRAIGGNPDPVDIELWEVGNEVYGGKPEVGGGQCASFGWEDVWTCDGIEYVVGDESHDGYLAIREAMLAVDPGIEVGAVGVGDPSGWSDWGHEVVAAAGDHLDFYVVHQYGFDASPDAGDAVHRPAELWPALLDDVRNALGGNVPIAVTEHNLVSFEAGDTQHSMTQAMNALYLADTIGQLASGGVALANQWNLANGTTSSGTDYGLISLADGSYSPAYEAMRLWSTMASELIDVEMPGDADSLRAYATKYPDDRVTLLLLNLDEPSIEATVALRSDSDASTAVVSGVYADDLESSHMSTLAESRVDVVDRSFGVQLPGWSIIKVQVSSDG